MGQKIQRHILKFREWAPWFTAALAVLSANWAASAFYETVQILLSGVAVVISPLRAGYIAFFVSMVILFYRQRKAFSRPHTRYLSNEPAEKRKHLVLFLSSLPEDIEKSNGVPDGLKLFFRNPDDDIIAIEDGKKSGIRWSWEMPLRAIRHHLGTLETVTLICSKESLLQAPLFLNICMGYPQLKIVKFYLLVKQARRTKLVPISHSSTISPYEGFDYESVDELSRALWVLLVEFKERKYLEHESIIDITGGQKITSVIAATMTFNREMKAQYVQTNFPWDVLSYDIILASSETGRLGI
jgi:hypothetical protein